MNWSVSGLVPGNNTFSLLEVIFGSDYFFLTHISVSLLTGRVHLYLSNAYCKELDSVFADGVFVLIPGLYSMVFAYF